ncbi:hypothetical protein JOB18_004822 [Solea senegalensis]|uniref:Uncharacterized protein n=1 Tax=Solea senegalensis TaxID=28829 RepID=A0AAV6T3J5_SOLSE|nr:hypothetical protein JOB18_004822 [Solea senegalensis]
MVNSRIRDWFVLISHCLQDEAAEVDSYGRKVPLSPEKIPVVFDDKVDSNQGVESSQQQSKGKPTSEVSSPQR